MTIPIKMTVRANYAIGTPPPEYMGITTITPSLEAQVLQTDNTWVKSNITIEPMNQYTGAIEFTPTDDPQTILTAGTYVTDDISILPIPPLAPPEVPNDSIIFYSRAPFSLYPANQQLNWDGTIWYSTDQSTWTIWNGTSITAAALKKWYVLYLRGQGNHVLTGAYTAENETVLSPYRWILQNDGELITCKGNLQNLINNANEPMQIGGLSYLFSFNTNLDCDIVLPNQMIDRLYTGMFMNCAALLHAPALTHTTVSSHAYESMFRNCVNLRTPPTILALSVEDSACASMFAGCTQLMTTPDFSTITTLNYASFEYAFSNCYNLATIIAFPSITEAPPYCYRNMFQNCYSLMEAPNLTATTVNDGSYQFMFSHCTALFRSPESAATTLGIYCYSYMFERCTSLLTPMSLPATTLFDYCYEGMYNGCTSLNTLPQLTISIASIGSCTRMFAECSSIQLSEESTAIYTRPYQINCIETSAGAFDGMFEDTGGTFQYDPEPNVTYYTSNAIKN